MANMIQQFHLLEEQSLQSLRRIQDIIISKKIYLVGVWGHGVTTDPGFILGFANSGTWFYLFHDKQLQGRRNDKPDC